jgi:hypothetical protein
MNKTKDPKTPNSFQTLAGVSMMMLQPITAGAGSTSTPDLVSYLNINSFICRILFLYSGY